MAGKSRRTRWAARALSRVLAPRPHSSLLTAQIENHVYIIDRARASRAEDRRCHACEESTFALGFCPHRHSPSWFFARASEPHPTPPHARATHRFRRRHGVCQRGERDTGDLAHQCTRSARFVRFAGGAGSTTGKNYGYTPRAQGAGSGGSAGGRKAFLPEPLGRSGGFGTPGS